MKTIDILSVMIIAVLQVAVNAQITWLGSPFAKSTINPIGESVLQPSNSGAQFPYSKDSEKGPLVSVKLVNSETGLSEILQTDFDMIAQKCSCYWIDMKDLVERFGSKIKESRSYKLQFYSSTYQASSGFFAIITSDETDIKTLTDPTTGSTGTKTATKSGTLPSNPVVNPRSSAERETVTAFGFLTAVAALLL